jgi:hypothetical protein
MRARNHPRRVCALDADSVAIAVLAVEIGLLRRESLQPIAA